MSPLTREQTDALLSYVRGVARDTLSRTAHTQAPGFLTGIPYGGAFVTFKSQGTLRGCMGRLRATGPLPESLADITRSSLNDPRFTSNPITAEELPSLTIEVSILGPVEVVKNPGQLRAGIHGVVISKAGCSGCFLPQVATEHGWSIEEFLSACCTMKAGLPADAWRDPQTQVEAFEVRALREEQPLGNELDP